MELNAKILTEDWKVWEQCLKTDTPVRGIEALNNYRRNEPSLKILFVTGKQIV